MDNQERQTDIFLINSKNAGPGAYNHQDYKNKQNFNTGQVPFGSVSMLENGSVFTLMQPKGVRHLPTTNAANPGPGQYSVPMNHIGLASKSPLRAAY